MFGPGSAYCSPAERRHGFCPAVLLLLLLLLLELLLLLLQEAAVASGAAAAISAGAAAAISAGCCSPSPDVPSVLLPLQVMLLLLTIIDVRKGTGPASSHAHIP